MWRVLTMLALVVGGGNAPADKTAGEAPYRVGPISSAVRAAVLAEYVRGQGVSVSVIGSDAASASAAGSGNFIVASAVLDEPDAR